MKNLKHLNNGDVVYTTKQIAGYGRYNREWINTKNNLTFSIVLKPKIKIKVLPTITQYAAITIVKLLEAMNIDASIKWPNDVLVKNKKIAGILTQTSLQGNQTKGIVIGIGLNIGMDDNDINVIDQPATAINLEQSDNVDTNTCLKQLLDIFFQDLNNFYQSGFPFIKSYYQKKSTNIGKQIKIKLHSEEINGFAEDINNDGSLQIVTDSGKKQNIDIGEIMF
jgi:BirA family biotin operon repressor/biotin-[acetyl-CoA-carboxylase] ligase